jgi:hypothetical protein
MVNCFRIKAEQEVADNGVQHGAKVQQQGL